jgi:hypothetical protein
MDHFLVRREQRNKASAMTMPRGPKGEKRPADVIGKSTLAARIRSGYKQVGD